MHARTLTFAAAWLCGVLACAPARCEPADPRLREIWYDPHEVVTILVKRGIVTHVVLDADESITDVGSGLGADCSKPEASWCIAAQPGGRNIFVKPKSNAGPPNNLAVVTDRRTHSLRFVVLPDGDARAPVYRLSIKAPVLRVATPAAPPSRPAWSSEAPAAPASAPTQTEPVVAPDFDLVAQRLTAAPEVLNTSYSIAQGAGSDDIVPTLVFDDGRFTYFRFPNNREVPAVFHVLGDGAETLTNAHMEDDLLVVDRVSRRLMLRAGSAVVGVWNDAFDLDGVPPTQGTTVNGVERVIKAHTGSGNAAGGER